MTEVERIAQVLVKRFAGLEPNPNYGWHIPSLDVIDCVLSLNRPYFSFVKPRVEAFAERQPDLTSLHALKKLIDSYPSPLAFSVAELSYRDAGRAKTLRGVVEYLLRCESEFEGKTERTRLRRWAKAVKPSDYSDVGVKGFGLAGFQYLRMLFGAQTTKPDVHIKRFIRGSLGRRVSDVEAIALLEGAARLAGLPVREAENAVWRKVARKGPQGT